MKPVSNGLIYTETNMGVIGNFVNENIGNNTFWPKYIFPHRISKFYRVRGFLKWPL